jgi:hypothetical protein
MARVVGVLHGGAVGSPDPDQSTVAVIAVLDQSACRPVAQDACDVPLTIVLEEITRISPALQGLGDGCQLTRSSILQFERPCAERDVDELRGPRVGA